MVPGSITYRGLRAGSLATAVFQPFNSAKLPTLSAALTPTFGATTPTADGFTVPITNYNSAYTWAVTATASGTVAINGTGLVTVTGVVALTSSTATITTTRTGYGSRSATVTATSLAAAAHYLQARNHHFEAVVNAGRKSSAESSAPTAQNRAQQASATSRKTEQKLIDRPELSQFYRAKQE